MKKLLFTVCMLVALQSMGQGFEKGTKNFNLGVGAGYGLGANASLDVGIHEIVSVGLIGSFSTRNYGVLGYSWRTNYIFAGARVAAHFGKYISKPLGISESKIDPYVGLSGGIRRVSYSDTYSSYYDGATNGIFVGVFAGARYALKNNLGVYAEAGTPFSSLGITFKF